MKNIFIYSILLLLLLPGAGMTAKEKHIEDKSIGNKNTAVHEKSDKTADKKAKKNRTVISPVVFYSPETSMAFGAAGSRIFRSFSKDEEAKPSSISPFFVYTLKKQIIASLALDIYFKNNTWHLTGNLGFMKFPTKFYGIGPGSLQAMEEDYTPRNFFVFMSLLREIGGGFHAGIQYHLMDWKLQEVEPGGQLDMMGIRGSERGTISGLGLVLNRDTRNHIYNPYSGDWMDLNVRFYRKAFGSTHRFTNVTLDLRKYVPLFSRSVFAARLLIQHQYGSVPFMEMAKMGGPNLMRGYFEGRFRDKNLIALQTEYRFPISGRFRGVGFVSAGNVSHTPAQMNFSNLKFSYGAGVRFLMLKNENIYLRFDIGFNEEGSGFYFGIFEAF